MGEFKKFALSQGVSSMDLYYAEKALSSDTKMVTPYILEEREMRATQMDIFSRMMKDRILFVTGPVNQHMCDVLQAQLLFLDQADKGDIKMYLNTPGGSVSNGLGIRDVMNLIKCDINTVNLGMCASMGSILVSSGTKGKRQTLDSSRIMVHQVSHGAQGHIMDININQEEAIKYNYMLFRILEENSKMSFDGLLELAKRDKWFSASESVEVGLVDSIIINPDKPTTDYNSLMVGFEEYKSKISSDESLQRFVVK